MSISVSAPAKIILFGEHAVVYGEPAIATPVSSLRATAVVEPGSGGLRITVADLPTGVDAETVNAALHNIGQAVLQQLSVGEPDLHIRIESQIPVASGLGSGAAVAAVIARAICHALERPVSSEDLNRMVYEIEKLHHGTPSGIDNTVVVYEETVYFVRERQIEYVKVGVPLRLVIGDTGISTPTKIPVGDVRQLYEREPERIKPLLSAIGQITREARTALENGDSAKTGALMTRNHALLRDLTVSSAELDRLVQAAVNAGALGAKLSGGGRGGNMIALVTDETQKQVEQALTTANAVRVYTTTIKPKESG